MYRSISAVLFVLTAFVACVFSQAMLFQAPRGLFCDFPGAVQQRPRATRTMLGANSVVSILERAAKTGSPLTISADPDDIVILYHNNTVVDVNSDDPPENCSPTVSGTVVPKVGDVIALSAGNSGGGPRGVAVKVTDKDGNTGFLSPTDWIGVESNSEEDGPFAYPDWVPVGWKSAIGGDTNSQCVSMMTEGASTMWADDLESDHKFKYVHLRLRIGGEKDERCVCTDGDGCPAENYHGQRVCDNCILLYDGGSRHSCYPRWSQQECISASENAPPGEEYVWCGDAN